MTQNDLKYIKENALSRLGLYIDYSNLFSDSEPEIINRWYCEYLFGDTFEKVNPSFLRGKGVGGGDLELDGYSPSLKIAFEYNGPQHYDLEW